MLRDFGAFLLVLSRLVVSAVVGWSLEANPEELRYDSRKLFLLLLRSTPTLSARVVMTLQIICISQYNHYTPQICRYTSFFVG